VAAPSTASPNAAPAAITSSEGVKGGPSCASSTTFQVRAAASTTVAAVAARPPERAASATATIAVSRAGSA